MQEDKYKIPISGQRFSELLFRHFVVPTLTSSPSETTTAWNDNGTRVDFRIGELVRVIENNSPVFYRLVDISNGKAVWENISSGDFSKYYSKEDINDIIATLRENIANTYISEIPEEYITQSELDSREYVTRSEIEMRNVSAIDTDEQIDDVNVQYATTQYVNNAIAAAIITTINASY